MSVQKISLNNLRFYAYHGVEPQEQSVGAWYVINLDMYADITASLQSDELSDTLNYAQAARIIKEEMQVPSKLMEHVAGRVVQRLQQEFPALQRLSFTIAKENPPVCAECGSASITVEAGD
ncbi:MAG: dihydroneopterin aldolase [Bacteroidaceae bacterium]|nr:dihydroneopterin aldolase [Bacteroidaceae bacterium]